MILKRYAEAPPMLAAVPASVAAAKVTSSSDPVHAAPEDGAPAAAPAGEPSTSPVGIEAGVTVKAASHVQVKTLPYAI